MINSGVADVAVCMGGFRCFLFRRANNLLKTIYDQHGPCMWERLIKITIVEVLLVIVVAPANTNGSGEGDSGDLHEGRRKIGRFLRS